MRRFNNKVKQTKYHQREMLKTKSDVNNSNNKKN